MSLVDENKSTTSSVKCKEIILGPPNWKSSIAWLHVDNVSLKVMKPVIVVSR